MGNRVFTYPSGRICGTGAIHAETIAIAEPDGSVRNLGTIANRAKSIRKVVRKLEPADQLRACYEAGPTGYVLYWQLAALDVKCEVIAPTLIPTKPGDRVKRLEQAIAEAVKLASPAIQKVVKGLQALRGIAQISVVTIAAELGHITRFEGARQLTGYSIFDSCVYRIHAAKWLFLQENSTFHALLM